MVNWDEFTPIETYQTKWGEEKNILSSLFDLSFNWINDVTESRYISLDQQRKNMLSENPDLNIKRLDDGFNLEVERLNAIQQQSSRGFEIVDINPGLLDSLDYPLTLPYEFIFDGTNFLNDINGSFVKNFRSVNIPIAGNFLKVEFLYENNSSGNVYYQAEPPSQSRLVPSAQIKYFESYGDQSLQEFDLVTNQDNYTFDQFARNKVFVNFGDDNGKPHLIGSNGKIFKTYFSEVNISLNIGAPKIRVTIGYNSEIYESTSQAAPINSQLHLTGAGRLFSDSDTVMSPFCLTQNNSVISSSANAYGVALGTTPIPASFTWGMIFNNGYSDSNVPAVPQNIFGYSVVFISRIFFQKRYAVPNVADVFNIYMYVGSKNYPTIGGVSQAKSVHEFVMGKLEETYVAEFKEPKRVVIPAGSALYCRLIYAGANTALNLNFTYSIDGYSYGELIQTTSGSDELIQTSKFLTDSTFLADFNRIRAVRS